MRVQAADHFSDEDDGGDDERAHQPSPIRVARLGVMMVVVMLVLVVLVRGAHDYDPE
jgi:hypothetical protein